MLIGAGVYYACYRIYTSTVFGTLGDWLDEQEAQMTEKERKELEEETEPFIIPLPFTTKQVEPLPYKGSDPEWQTFVKVSKNPALIRDLECTLAPNNTSTLNHAELTAFADKLATICKKALESHPLIVHRYGKDARIVQYMVDVLFPSKPPPTFVRKGYVMPPSHSRLSVNPIARGLTYPQYNYRR